MKEKKYENTHPFSANYVSQLTPQRRYAPPPPTPQAQIVLEGSWFNKYVNPAESRMLKGKK